MEMQYIIYMQEACGQSHIDHYRSNCAAYILLMIDNECQQKLNAKYTC